jgi:long-subunit acyl-CoA synthetase (AMP-forming)
VENGLLTPTLKVKRHQVAKAFDKEIKELYSQQDANKQQIQAKL